MIRQQVMRVATADPRGFGRLDLSCVDEPVAIDEAAATFRELGFACVQAARAREAERRATIERRHVAVFVLSDADQAVAADVIGALARPDGRRRVLVHAVPLPFVTAVRSVAWWRARQARVSAFCAALIAASDAHGALDISSALVVEAACRGMPVDPNAAIRRVQACYQLGRFEEASMALRGASGAPDCGLWHALVAWAQGDPSDLRSFVVCRRRPSRDKVSAMVFERAVVEMNRYARGRRAMNLLQAMPRLLQVVHETEDENAILRRACAWLAESAGTSGAAILAREDLRIVAGEGIDAGDVAESRAAEVLRTGTPRTIVSGTLLTCVPVRYAAATIGVVIARGDPARAETMVEAATMVASTVGMALRARLDALALSGRGEALARDILGESLVMSELRESIARAAGSAFPVLIEGESGTGKELVASALHRLSARRDRRLCAVNCAALTDDLIEAEMFGHTRGAFTGAVGARPGLFEEAHRSSLFLDEVAELSPRGQAKLLRVLQEREIRRLGENTPRAVDVRVIGATNLPLAEAVAQGRFREDLRFRLAVIRLRVPALRERIEDVPLLARAFWRRLSADSQTRAVLGPEAVASLCRHAWPGNVRELQNVVSALIVSAPTRGLVTSRHVAVALGAAGSETTSVRLDTAMRGFERRVVAAALARHGGRRTGAARELGLTRQGLTKAIRRLGLNHRVTERAGVA